MKITKGPTTLFYPCPVALVTCSDETGKDDIVTLAWIGVANSTPPIIAAGIRPTRYSASLIDRTGEFVVNIPSVELLEVTDYCGSVSGADVTKFEATGLTREKASQVKAPLIKECPVNLECRVKQKLVLGSHHLYLGEVLETHVDQNVLDPEGNIDYTKAQPIAYTPREYWDLGKRLHVQGFSKTAKQEAQQHK